MTGAIALDGESEGAVDAREAVGTNRVALNGEIQVAGQRSTMFAARRRRGSGLQERVNKVWQSIGDPKAVEHAVLFGDLSGAPFRAACNVRYRGRNRRRGTVREQPRRTTECVGYGARRPRDHRHTVGHRLDQWHAKALMQAQRHICVGLGVPPSQLIVGHGAGQHDAVAETVRRNPPLDLLKVGIIGRIDAADQNEPRLARPLFAKLGKCVDQISLAFRADDPSDEQHGERRFRRELGPRSCLLEQLVDVEQEWAGDRCLVTSLAQLDGVVFAVCQRRHNVVAQEIELLRPILAYFA